MSTSQPLVSIIMPARNMAPWIGDTLHSVLNQSMTNFECLVIDDGSTDTTPNVVRSMNDTRIRLIPGESKGVSAARNLGLQTACGAYITFLDADDLWSSHAVASLTAPLLSDPLMDVAWGHYLRFDDITHKIIPIPGTFRQQTENLWLDMLVDNFLPMGTFCIRQSALLKAGLFDTTLTIGEDRDWLLRVFKGRRTVHIPTVAHYYRQRTGSSMRDPQRFLDDEQSMMARHLADPQVPPAIRQRSLAVLAFHQAVLECKQGKFVAAIASMMRALYLDPFYMNLWWRPVHKLLLKVQPAQFLQIPVK